MQISRRVVVGLAILFLVLFFISETAIAADEIRFDTPTVGVIIAVLVASISMIFTFAFAGGIKYVTPENVLDTEVRKSLYQYIDDFPGSHLREIARELDLKPSNAAWHLRKLEQTNLVRSRTIGGKKVYYLVEGGIEARKEAIAEAVLRNKNARDIMLFLQENPVADKETRVCRRFPQS